MSSIPSPSSSEWLSAFAPDDDVAHPSGMAFALRTGARIAASDAGPIIIAGGARFGLVSPPEIAVAQRLGAGRAREDEMLRAFLDAGGEFVAFLGFLFDFSASGMLDRLALASAREIARLETLSPLHGFDPILATGVRFRLSRFACLRREGGAVAVETPLGAGRVLLGDAGIGCLSPLLAGCDVAGLARSASIEETAAGAVLLLLHNARAIAAEREDGGLAEDDAPLGRWEYHDLLFHSRSRLGRHDSPYGGTYHRKGVEPPPPFLRPPPETRPIALPEADLERLRRSDPPFADVLASRRSRRDYGDTPPDLAQLGEFLHRSARVQQVIRTADDDMDYSYRPHPGGGAIHELVIYAVIGQCDGLDRGIYRYDPLAHTLLPLDAEPDRVDRLLDIAWITGDRKSRPQIYFAITADFARLQWKYQSIVYAVILKNVGALYQTMYLAATAMGLAPCALGGGDSEQFAQAARLARYEEELVGEFLLGSAPR